MKVIYDSNEIDCEHGWLTMGNVYAVLGILGGSKGVQYRLLGNNKATPALHDASYFTVISAKIPNDWVFTICPDAEWELSPEVWSGSFWDDFFNLDKSKMELFYQYLNSIDI